MKISVRWFLFEYKGLELVILSKGFETKTLGEKARLKYPDRTRRRIGVGINPGQGLKTNVLLVLVAPCRYPLRKV